MTFGYESGRPVLHDVNLDVRPGETVAIVGATGAGKSTLAGLVPRFYDPWSGRVTIDGHDLRDLRLKGLRSQVAVVLQEPFLLPMSIADNIAYGRPERLARRDRGGGPRRQRPRLHHAAARGLRDGARRARRDAVGRRAAAPVDRPGAAEGRADPDPRRADQRRRCADRVAAAGRARAADERAHHHRHRPPHVHDGPRRPHRRAGARAGRRSRHAGRAAAAAGRRLRAVPRPPVGAGEWTDVGD